MFLPERCIMKGGQYVDEWSPIARFQERCGKAEEDHMFRKGSSHDKDEQLPPAPQLQNLTPANLADPEIDGNVKHWSRHDSRRQDF
jgi:hypothetical protein